MIGVKRNLPVIVVSNCTETLKRTEKRLLER